MKMLRAAVALAFLLIYAPAFAQWQAPNHSVPLGRGAGVTGFGSAAPGTSGQPFVSQGASADPAFGTIANSGFAAGAADTYKGSLNGTTVVDVPRAPCTSVNQALRYTAGVGESCGNIVIQTGYDMPVNFGLSAPAPSGGALTINLTQANGSAPTSSSPVLVPFRATALATGTVTWSTISAPQSITIPSGATLGTSNGVPFRVWIFEAYNGGTPELGVATCSSAKAIFPCASWESTLVTSTTISAGAGTAGKLYTTTGVTLDAVRIIGYCEFSSGLATAGSWTNSCTTLQPFGPGVSRPGAIVQGPIEGTPSTSTASSSSATKVEANPTVAITPTSTPNLIHILAQGTLEQVTSAIGCMAILSRGTSYNAITTGGIGATYPGNTTTSVPVTLFGLDAPGSVSSTTYVPFVFSSGSGTCTWNGAPESTTPTSTIEVYEIMG